VQQAAGVKSGQVTNAVGSASQTPRLGKLNIKSHDYKSAGADGGDLTRGNDDLINFMEQKLEQQEKNLVVKQQEYDSLLYEHQNLQSQFN